MSSMRLFAPGDDGKLRQLSPWQPAMERELQRYFEVNLQTLLGVSFLETELVAGQGRIDTIGLDEALCPVIIEYKVDETNVLSQGLSYINWLMDHKADFAVLVGSKLGVASADIDWSGTRVICVAQGFTNHDVEALTHVNANVDLLTYSFLSENVLSLALAGQKRRADYRRDRRRQEQHRLPAVTYESQLRSAPPLVAGLVAKLEAMILACGPDVVISRLAQECFFSVHEDLGRYWITKGVHPRLKVALAAAEIDEHLVPGVIRRDGSLEFSIRNEDDLAIFQPILEEHYRRKVLF
ncbi:PDDEXK family nuclease [Pseudomonas aeruginosa]